MNFDTMVILNFKFKKCRSVFDYDIGKIKSGWRLGFENEIYCGGREIDDLILTENGQNIVAELYFKEMK